MSVYFYQRRKRVTFENFVFNKFATTKKTVYAFYFIITAYWICWNQVPTENKIEKKSSRKLLMMLI